MITSLPHSKEIDRRINSYLDDFHENIEQSISDLRKSSTYKTIFKNSQACFSILKNNNLSKHSLIKIAAGIPRRIPLLIAARQVSPAYIELRRFTELIVWNPYFIDHPIEWDEFSKNPDTGYTRDPKTPIAFCAHREISWYFDYARELYKSEPSGLTKTSINSLQHQYRNLSKYVHAMDNPVQGKILSSPFDDISDKNLSKFQNAQKVVFLSSSLLICSKRKQLEKLEAIERDWFDWLISKKNARIIRSERFGI